MVTDIRIIVPTALPSGPNVIWETNFSSDNAFSAQNTGGYHTSQPVGWTALKAVFANSIVSGEAGTGDGGSSAIKIAWDPVASAPTISLSKQISGSKTIGYSELYVRVNIKLPNNFKIGDGTVSLGYWKWMRFWMNTGTTNDGTWTENREDSYNIVWNFAGSNTFGHDVNITAAGSSADVDTWARDQGSVLGGRARLDYFISSDPDPKVDREGHFEHMPGWEIDTVTSPGFLVDRTTQSYHTIETRIKAASSPGADDGEFQIWFDGVDQGTQPRIESEGITRYGDITNTSQENPCEVTVNGATSDDFQTGDQVYIHALDIGMSELNARTFTITRVDSTHFTLDGEDATGHTAWSASETNAQARIYIPASTFTGLPTAVEGAGTGWNWVGIFDNISGLNTDWSDVGVDGYVLLSDVVIATSRIGHTDVYQATDDGSGF